MLTVRAACAALTPAHANGQLVDHHSPAVNVPINAKRLRSTLPDIVERVRKNTRFVVHGLRSFAVMRELKVTTVITTDSVRQCRLARHRHAPR